MTIPVQALAEVFTGRLLNSAIEGVGLAGLVWIFLRMVRRQNSGARFVVWFSALLAIGFIPFITAAIAAAVPPFAQPSMAHSRVFLPRSAASYLFAAWAVVAGLLLLRLAIGLWRLFVIRRNCAAVGFEGLAPEIAAVCRDFKSVRRATLCISPDVRVPAAIGFFRPAVVFPSHLFGSLSTEETKAILLHELAHLRRWDDWTNLAQKVVKALFFFHPAVWWIDNQLSLEREMACDDVVLAEIGSPKVYASSLISFTEKLQHVRRPALVQALVSRMRHMTLRVTQILDSKRPHGDSLGRPALGAGAALFATALLAAPYLPTLVAFRSDNVVAAPTYASSAPSLPAQSLPAPGLSNMQHPSAVTARTAPQPRVIAAAFHPRPARKSQPKLLMPANPHILRARLNQDVPAPDSVLILQTTRYERAGRQIWTLSVWRVGGNNWADRQLESAWVVSSI